MTERMTSRGALLLVAVAMSAVAACSDSGTTQPGLLGPSAQSGPGGSSAGGKDSSGSHTPAQTPVSKFTLNVHVGSLRPGATDTVTTDPVANATVKVIQQSYTFIPHAGSDTVQINTTIVATASTDATGNVSIPGLTGTADYIIRVDPPVGSVLGPATTDVTQAFADVVKRSITLHGR